MCVQTVATTPNEDAAATQTLSLAQHWLHDQSLAFAATLLGDMDPFFEARPYACTTLLAEHIETIRAGRVSDSTLALIISIDPGYLCARRLTSMGLRRLAGTAEPLTQAVSVAKDVLKERDAIAADGLNRVLISHAVYALTRSYIDAVKFLKWLHRVAPQAVPGVPVILKHLLQDDAELCQQIKEALNASRDPDRQTCDRLDQIDRFYDLVLQAAGYQMYERVQPWWTRICIAYRHSLFCWPLLAEGTAEASPEQAEAGQGQLVRGLSLPIALSVREDGRSTWRPQAHDPDDQCITFAYALSPSEARTRKEPRFCAARNGLAAHVEGFRFGFTRQWGRAFAVGMDVAKKLWSSQNGRLRFADQPTASMKHTASLHVDLRAACDIVESVYARIPEQVWQRSGLRAQQRFFVVDDRSAEAYWVQCVLGLLLPARAVPLGLCTGTIEHQQGDFRMGDVAGIVAKLEYANRVGVPRIIIPGDRRAYDDEDDTGAPDAIDATAISTESESEPSATTDLKAEIKAFLRKLYANGTQKTLEVNFARSPRAAADAMQPAGWRRTNFMRTPGFQRAFDEIQSFLYLRDTLKDPTRAKQLERTQITWYNKRREWFDAECERLARLDDILLSYAGSAVKYVQSKHVLYQFPYTAIEQTLGKWVAWKDHQVRNGIGLDYRGPGLGVLVLRTAEGDNETRLWAALAEMLDANPDWWEQFQWSDLPQAANLLAQLLCNQRADSKISLGSAPDVLVIFDDAGITQRRTNVVFPKDFHHQFFDLLNPKHPDNRKHNYLDEALKRHGQGALGHPTRIIVVTHPQAPRQADTDDDALVSEDHDLLQRLEIFRFGCTRQVGFAMARFDRPPDAPMHWEAFEQSVQRLITGRWLTRNRNILQLTPKARQRISGNTLFADDPLRRAAVHRHAALSLCPILHPQSAYAATNRDQQLEPENVLEADWHLKRAVSLISPRFRLSWDAACGKPSVFASQTLLTFLRTAPDWDTVKRLRLSSQTYQDSVELCHELFRIRHDRTGLKPSSPTVGLVIETMGYTYRDVQKLDMIEPQAARIVDMVDQAVANLHSENLTSTERKRRLRHLFSRQIYALRMLGFPLTDPQLKGAKSYIDTAIADIMHKDFLTSIGAGREGLDDFPISRGCWQTLWSDGNGDTTPNRTLTLIERSRYAYAAALANLEQTRGGQVSRASWDLPWIAYFSLTHPADIAPEQLFAPLKTWSNVYDQMPETSRRFGQRVLDMQRHTKRVRKENRWVWKDQWSCDIVQANRNLWHYVTHSDAACRLIGRPVATALRLIHVLALQETLIAFHFLSTCDRSWLEHWPRLIHDPPNLWPDPATNCLGVVAKAWRALGRTVVSHTAAWVVMLAEISSLPDDQARLHRVRNWLTAFGKTRGDTLIHADPENLLRPKNGTPWAMEYKAARERAHGAADNILSLRDDRGKWALYGYRRTQFIQIKDALKY